MTPNPEPKPARRSTYIALGSLAFLTLVVFGGTLFGPAGIVLSNRDTDGFLQYYFWRAFGFHELAHGHLALWNPHLFSGSPFFGSFEAALLYPPNALFLVLPLAQAVNWSIALHVFLAGAFTYLWAARRGLHPAAAFLSGVIFMFCGANFLRVYAGHLPHLCALVWAPLLFLAIDGLFESPSLGWSLLGMFALAMQVLAGEPQYVFYTGIAAVIYSALCCFPTKERGRFMQGLVAIMAGGVALGAVQLFSGWQESRETLRSQGEPYAFAAMFSLPPENFLTLLAPGLFGDEKGIAYWGRGYWWEMCCFIGIAGMALAILGAAVGPRPQRRFSIIMVSVLVVLALGRHTPLFNLLYHAIPGFDEFRGTSKFFFLASLFLALLAGIGFNGLLERRLPSRTFVVTLGAAGLLLLAGGLAVRHSATEPGGGWWHSLMLGMRTTGETWATPKNYDDSTFALLAGQAAARSLFIGGATLLLVMALFAWSHKYRPAIWALLAVAVIELVGFAWHSLDNFDLADLANPQVKNYLQAHPGDYRILNLGNVRNSALVSGAYDIWGYEPGVLLRYAQLLAGSQGLAPDRTAVLMARTVPFPRDHPLLGMFRCRFVFVPQGNNMYAVERTNWLPHLLLVSQCRVLTNRDQILSSLTNTTFDPRQEVILENTPSPSPQLSPDPGSATLTASDTDSLTIEANVKSPAILLVTDNYARGWRARALPGSSQSHYDVMPANYCLRAIPLSAGTHRLRLEYLPSGYVIGKWTSLAAVTLFLGLLVWWGRHFADPRVHRPAQ